MATENEVKELINKMSGNSDVITKRYYDSLVIEQRILGCKPADMHMELFGDTLPMPVTMGVIGGFHHLGENALEKSALAAKELGTVLWTSSHTSPEDLKHLISLGVKVGVVVKPFADQEKFIATLKACEEAGAWAVATDIDHAFKDGEFDVQGSTPFTSKTFEELKEAREAVHIPFIAKGVLSVRDALICQKAGLDGVILSHHHNIYPSAIPPVMILPAIREAVGKEYAVLVDCGITSGVEAFKALALGASGVLVARGYMAPLAKEGTEGVVNYLRKVVAETRELMNRTASEDIYHIDSTVIHKL